MENEQIMYLILAASLVVVISYFFNLLARRTHIPSVLMLMALGYGIGLVVDIEPGTLTVPLTVLGTVGVILIVLEAALDIHLDKKSLPILWKSLLVAVFLLAVTSALVMLVLIYALDMGYMQSALYAVPLSVMSSAIIIPSVQGLLGDKREFLIVESAFSDIFGIVLFYALLSIAHAEDGFSGGLGLKLGLSNILTLVVAVVASYGLIIVFQSLREGVKLFLLIAVLLALYAAGKTFHLSSLLIILVFGLIINNRDRFFRGKLREYIDEDRYENVLKELKTITLESAFVVRTFFFVVFGLSLKMNDLLNPMVWLITALVLISIYFPRIFGLALVFGRKITPQLFVAPRGLITVLLFYALPKEYVTDLFPDGVLLLTILGSSFIMTYGLISAGASQTEALDAAAASMAGDEAREGKHHDWGDPDEEIPDESEPGANTSVNKSEKSRSQTDTTPADQEDPPPSDSSPTT